MRTAKRILLFLLLVLTLGRAALAEEWPGGSITVRLRWQGQPVAGGTLTLYRVGDEGYRPAEAFADCGVELTAPFDGDLARELAAYAQTLPGQTKTVGTDGTVVFQPLEAGLYLVVQRRAAEGYLPIEPFLVGIPMQAGDDLIWHVDASPKASPAPRLPQTGQLSWPVPVMAAAGVLLLLAGRRKRDA